MNCLILKAGFILLFFFSTPVGRIELNNDLPISVPEKKEKKEISENSHNLFLSESSSTSIVPIEKIEDRLEENKKQESSSSSSSSSLSLSLLESSSISVSLISKEQIDHPIKKVDDWFKANRKWEEKEKKKNEENSVRKLRK